MLSVKPVRNEFLIWVKLVYDPVCVLLDPSSEDDHLVEVTKLIQELLAEWPYQEVALPFVSGSVHIMNEGLVKIKHEGVLALRREPAISRWAVYCNKFVIVGHWG